MERHLRKLLLISLVLIMSFCLCACGKSDDEEIVKFSRASDIDGCNVAVITGSIGDAIANEKMPLSKQFSFSSVGDSVAALQEGKVDAAILDYGICKSVAAENDELTYINDSLRDLEYGAIFAKENVKDWDDFNAFIKELTLSGDLTLIRNRWQVEEEPIDIDYDLLPNTNGEFKVACDPTSYPFVFSRNGKYTGLEIEIVYKYCLSRGYKLVIETCDFPAVLAAVGSGKVNIGMSGIIYTDERAQTYNFSYTYAESNMISLIRKENAYSKINNVEDLVGGTVAVVTGGICDEYTQNTIDDVTIGYYNSTSDLIEAITSKKADAMATSESTYSNELKDRTDLKKIGNVGYEQCGYLFPKTEEGEVLRRQVNEFLLEIKSNGLLDEMIDKWNSKTKAKTIDFASMQGTNGTLNFACSSAVGEPACYYQDGELAGLEIDIIVEFAKAYGYDVIFNDYSFSGMLQSVAASKDDFGGSNTAITEERKKSVLFSDYIYSAELIVCVYDDSFENTNSNLFSEMADSFERTFIKEDRYLLFAEGIKTTILISILAIVFGTILGLLLFTVFNLNIDIVNKALKSLSSLLSEMPTVVLLMIFYYIFFAGSNTESIWVSVLAFSILFGINVLNLLKTCFTSIDKGQFEAAYALGYSKSEAFAKIIIPQIYPTFFPLYKGNIVELIKGTSIVGYIAVQDLTKMSDIVRSRTYEAFFPLIISTIIYVAIIKLFKLLITIIAKNLDNHNRSENKVLKGIKR